MSKYSVKSATSSFHTADLMRGLPSNFAEQVLELELILQSDCSNVDAIQELIDLYSVNIIMPYYFYIDSC